MKHCHADANNYLANLKFALCAVLSAKVTTSSRHVPAHALSVFHTYVYRSATASYDRLLPPAATVSITASCGAAALQLMVWERGDPLARTARP